MRTLASLGIKISPTSLGHAARNIERDGDVGYMSCMIYDEDHCNEEELEQVCQSITLLVAK